jgi:adenylate kinase family enzyme
LVSTGPLVLHLNGPPGVGKSTLAGRWADEHPGTPADHLRRYADRLAARSEARPDAVRLTTTTDDVEGSYAALVAAVG